MEKEEYKKLISTIVPKENKLKNGLIAFIIGGLIGLLAEILVVVTLASFVVWFILGNSFEILGENAIIKAIKVILF